MYLGQGGELEHFGKFESRHHAGTILKAERSCAFCLMIEKEDFSPATVEIVKDNQNTRAGILRTGPAKIGSPKSFLAPLALPSFRDQPLEGIRRS